MQFHELPCSSLSFHAVPRACIHFHKVPYVSEQLTRTSQCLFLFTWMASTFSSCLSASNWSFDTFFFGGAVLNDFIFLLVKESIFLLDFMIIPGIWWCRISSYFASLCVNHLDVNWSTEVSLKCKCSFVFLQLETKQKKSDQGSNKVNNTINATGGCITS